MKKYFQFLSVVVTVTGTAISAKGKSESLLCPDAIKVHSQVQVVPKNWHSWDFAEEGKNAIKKFSKVEVYEGHPSKHSLLNPDTDPALEKTRIWNFKPFGEARKNPIWIACRYEDTQTVLAKSLVLKVSKCRMDFVADSSDAKPGPVICE